MDGAETLAFGDLLRRYRDAAGLTQEELAERAGLSSLNEGQTVEYEIESNRGKESAVKLKVK